MGKRKKRELFCCYDLTNFFCFLDDDEEDESPEDKDHLVAELYKHMEDRGSPIDRTPSIEGKDVDLYKLYRIVDKLGGNVRVNNKALWRQVANKLGFVSNWGINQVRVKIFLRISSGNGELLSRH